MKHSKLNSQIRDSQNTCESGDFVLVFLLGISGKIEKKVWKNLETDDERKEFSSIIVWDALVVRFSDGGIWEKGNDK